MKIYRKIIKPLIKRSVRKLKQYGLYLVEDYISKSRGSEFVFKFNLIARISASPARVRICSDKYIFSDLELPSKSIFSVHEKQSQMAYKYGFKFRAESLAETYKLKKIKFNHGDIVIDCGANVGDFKLWFDMNKINIKYIGFEPSPIEFECLKENIKDTNNENTCFNIGLWNKDHELSFYLSSQNADSSFIEPPSYQDILIIKAKRLDSFINARIKLLKLEGEGAEPEILEGIGDKLNLIDYVAADVGFERGVYQESTLAQTTNYLLKRGFEIVEINNDRLCILYENKL